jgi:SAM-dependent methyltransferase
MNITESSPRHSRGAYDNPFAFDNVYGHALELLARHRLQRHEALHIDIGCGYGRIAEPLKERLGLTYIACDLDEDALCSLDTRGFETHRLILGDEEAVYQALSQIIDKRPLASISIRPPPCGRFAGLRPSTSPSFWSAYRILPTGMSGCGCCSASGIIRKPGFWIIRIAHFSAIRYSGVC